jgi:outer membrane protein assembly factor BamA
VDDLLNELERVQTQKAELERKEKELKAAVSKKLEEQAERVKKLGIAPPPAKEKEPDRVGRIIIEGNTKTPDGKILDKLDLHSGQILQYPKLEAARARLEKAGFRGVVVEAIPNELDPTFKDIRVKIDESKLKPKPAPDPLPSVRG